MSTLQQRMAGAGLMLASCLICVPASASSFWDFLISAFQDEEETPRNTHVCYCKEKEGPYFCAVTVTPEMPFPEGRAMCSPGKECNYNCGGR